MSLPVVWSPSAREEYADLLQYLDDTFGTDAALKMLDRTEEVIDGISSFPRAYPADTIRSDIRKAVITQHTSLLYRVAETQVQLLHFWDNRQNPRRKEFL